MRTRTLLPISTAAAAVVITTALALAQDNDSDAARLTDVLSVRVGSVLADIGAGPEALLTIRMADRVGASGKIYASDLGESLPKLRQTLTKARLSNVELVEGLPSSTNLPDECCDGIFIRNVYHHFADPAAMNASLWKSLKPGGRLAIIDFPPRGPEANAPADRDEGDQHGVTSATVTRELLQAGFQLTTSEDRSDRWFLVVVEKGTAK